MDAEAYTQDVEALALEMQKEKPKRKTLRTLMASTFAGRRQWLTTDRPVVRDIIAKFPLLKTPKYVSICIICKVHA